MIPANDNTLAAVISTDGDITSVNGEQYLTLREVNPLIADGGALPSAYGARGDDLQFIYNNEDYDIRLTLDADGSMVSLELWQYDADNEAQTVGVNGEGGEWADIEGGDMWEQISVKLRGTNVAQQEAIDKVAKLRGAEPSEVTRDGEAGSSEVTARWTPQENPTDEEFEVRLNEYGQILGVAFSIYTEADEEEEAGSEWYRATELDGPWEELVEAGLVTAAK